MAWQRRTFAKNLVPIRARPFSDAVYKHPYRATLAVGLALEPLALWLAGPVGAISLALQVLPVVGATAVLRKQLHRIDKKAENRRDLRTAGHQRIRAKSLPDAQQLAEVLAPLPILSVTANVQAGRQVNYGRSAEERAKVIASHLAKTIRIELPNATQRRLERFRSHCSCKKRGFRTMARLASSNQRGTRARARKTSALRRTRFFAVSRAAGRTVGERHHLFRAISLAGIARDAITVT